MLIEIPAIIHESWLYFISFPDSCSVYRSIHESGLLIFRAVAEPWNSGKSHEIHKNPQNTTKFSTNLIIYMSVQHIWNLFQLLGLFTCCKLANLFSNFVTETCKQRSKTTRRQLCCEKLGTSHDVKGFAIGSFLERLKEQMITSVRKTQKTLIWSAQNRWIASETKICLENNHKISCLLPIALWRSLPWNFPRICPQKSYKIWLFSLQPIRSPDELCKIPSRLADPVLGRPLGMSLSLISKPFASCIEEKTMSPSVFYYSVSGPMQGKGLGGGPRPPPLFEK